MACSKARSRRLTVVIAISLTFFLAEISGKFTAEGLAWEYLIES
jgi:hypothetical protein